MRAHTPSLVLFFSPSPFVLLYIYPLFVVCLICALSYYFNKCIDRRWLSWSLAFLLHLHLRSSFPGVVPLPLPSSRRTVRTLLPNQCMSTSSDRSLPCQPSPSAHHVSSSPPPCNSSLPPHTLPPFLPLLSVDTGDLGFIRSGGARPARRPRTSRTTPPRTHQKNKQPPCTRYDTT